MKKALIVIGIIAICNSVSAWTNNASTTSAYIAPGRGLSSQYLPTRTNAMIVGAGQYVRVSGRIYMSVAAGTTTNPPSGINGWSTEDGVSWLYSARGKRTYLSIQNYSTSIVSVMFGSNATATDGIRLGANELWESDNPPQTPVQAITSGGSGNVAVTDW